jgi:hypothetical protein
LARDASSVSVRDIVRVAVHVIPNASVAKTGETVRSSSPSAAAIPATDFSPSHSRQTLAANSVQASRGMARHVIDQRFVVDNLLRSGARFSLSAADSSSWLISIGRDR